MLVNVDILKEQLGGVQTSLNFKTVLPFVKAAEYNFQKQIGKDLFGILLTFPITTATPGDQELQANLKYFAEAYVCWTAFDMAMPHLKFRIGDLGIMKSSPQNSVAVTKWEYVDSREANLSMADSSIENFYEILEELKPTEWTGSDAYKVRNGLFINSPQQLGQYVVLVGRNTRLFSQLAVYIKKVEELYISEVITEEVFTDLKTKLTNSNTVWTLPEKKLIEHIRKALSALSIQEAMPFLQLKIDEEGMREVRKKDGIREEEIASKGVRNRHIQAVSNDGELYLTRLRKFMDANSTAILWPSYYANSSNAFGSAQSSEEDYTESSHVIL